MFGCGRSGTSLLSRILNHHPNIAVPFESHVFNTYFPLLRYYGDLENVRNRRRLVADILASYYFRHWKPEPDEQLRELYPNARVIHIVRDGRDVAVSLIGARFGPKTVFKAAPSHRLMRLLFHSVQFLDGFETTADNVSGLLPEIFETAGFHDVSTHGEIRTICGTMTLYSAAKPRN